MTVLRRADTFIQRHFDACVHWVMLTFGVSKGFVRYALGALGVMCLVGLAVVGDRYAWSFVLLGLLSLPLIEVTKRQDDIAESAGAMSLSDQISLVPDWLPKVVFWLATMAWLAICVYLSAAVTAFHVLATLLTATHLALQYLRKTNPRPPEKRQRVLVTQTEAV